MCIDSRTDKVLPRRRNANMCLTLAKEASKRIVSDLLQTAGHGSGAADEELTDDIDFDIDIGADDGRYDGGEPTSPSVVRGAMIGDESF